METNNQATTQVRINYYVIAGILISILFFAISNAFEPQIDSQLDFFEVTFFVADFVTAGFALSIGLRYWPSKVFGKAYMALAIGFISTAVGGFLFDYLQIFYGIENPYPSWIDIFFAIFYFCMIYHLRTNVYFIRGAQKPPLTRSHKAILIAFPLAITSVFAFSLLVSVSVTEVDVQDVDSTLKLLPQVISNLSFDVMQEYDQEFWNAFYAGIFFVAATTTTMAWAIIGAQVFRGSLLGAPWGLLLVGIGLTTAADVSYYLTQWEYYDRANPIIAIWVLGSMIVCYALYLHKKQI